MSRSTAQSNVDLRSAAPEDQLAWLRQCKPDEARRFAREHDWSGDPRPVLGWVMAQKFMDLGTALTVFLNGMPHRFNYMPKRDVPHELCGAAQMLDTICLRLNSGFYLAWPDQDVSDRARILRWMDAQAEDRQEGRQGRYILDERIVATLLDDELRLDPRAETAVYHENRSLLRDLFSPVLELGVSRRMLRFHPPQEDPNGDLTNLRY
ncbi:hypothetical protein FIU89_12730 [Roseovarius sp. THAF27]|uniref:hypothetical protein n=1 Tax=unclassified Roseovarius TaxID=2614913 RepID=UPI00126922FE|nr:MULTISPECIES: hypothetical protein [unclassified Roseovarius]QFT81481.1 hypothetical protein FIU89_12730 [Roseovarius sp. THAF27]QFT99385.1 hypothetical protein FIU85_18865 [Roseovarius sp. THAF8]